MPSTIVTFVIASVAGQESQLQAFLATIEVIDRISLTMREIAEQTELLHGTLDALILKTLSWGPRHGYAVARWIERVTDDTLRVEEGSLYPALYRLERKGWIEAEWGLSENNRKAKYYQLTATGRRQLRVQTAAFTEYVGAMFKVLHTP